MIDIEKFICSLLADHPVGVTVREDIHKALKDQGLEYKGGKIVPTALQENEDERMWLIKYLQEEIDCLHFDIRDDEDRIKLKNLQSSLAWLEKLKVFTECGDGLYYFTNNKFTYVGNFTWDNDSWLEKQGEQKSTDKVEPKYKVGVWLVCCDYEPEQIIGIRANSYYEMSNGDSRPFYMIDNNHNIRIWTIREAKDGDVLATKNDIFIFKHIDKTGLSLCKSYCEIIGNSKLGFGFDFPINSIYPATKEQKDLLFKKMKESGYEWNAEKKELKKIEQKGINGNKREISNSAWSKEDENEYNHILKILNLVAEEQETKGHNNLISSISWLKSLKERYAWKPSDEQLHYLSWIANIKLGDSVVEQEVSKHLNELLEDLKKLREE